MSSKFSGIIQLNDLDDFIGPGQVLDIILEIFAFINLF